MALPTWYDTGTASVANGSASVTGTGTLWGADAIMAGDLFCDLAQPLVPPQRIASVEGNGALTLAAPWPGSALTDDAYEIRFVGIIERSTAQTRRVLEQLGEVSAYFDIQVDDTAARLALESVDAPLRANYRVLVSDIGDGTAAIYSKASSAYDDWTDPAPYSGPVGPTGPQGPEGVSWQGDYSGATAYALDDAVLYNGSSWRALGATTGNAPPTLPTTSNAYWQLLARQGIDGAGTVNSVVAGDGIAVDNSDPTAPVISATNTAGVNDTYLALLQASGGLTGFIGGIADAFADQTGVDDAASTNEVYDAAGDLYSPSLTYAGSDTLSSIALNSDSSGWEGYNMRQTFGAAVISASGTKVRLRLLGPAAGQTVIGSMTIAQQAGSGDAWDATGTMVPVTVGGSGSFTLTTGADIWSDPIDFALNEAAGLVISFFMTSPSNVRRKNGLSGDYNMYYKLSASETTTANVTGYTASAGWAVVIDEIEILTVDGVNDMTLISEDFSIDAEVDAANILVRVVGGEAYTVNTDLTAEVSRDGSTWELATLTLALTDGSSEYYLAGVDLSGQPSGTTMKWRVKTIGKLIDITGVSLQWGAMGLTLPLTSGSFTGPFPDGFPLAKLVAAYFFDEADPDSVEDLMGGTAIDLTEPANPNVTLTSKGFKLAAGLVQTPTLTGVRCQSLVYRVGRGETGSKFILSGGSGSTAGVLVDTLTVSETHRYGGSGFDLHTPYYHASTGEDAWEMNRGGWGFYHRQDTAARTSKYGFGGEHSNTTFRATEMEANCAFFWNNTLTSDELEAVYLFTRQRAAKVGIYLHRDDCPLKEDVFILMGDSTADGRAPWSDLSSDDKALDLRHSLIAAGDTSTVAAMDIMELGYNQQIADLADMGPEFGIAYARRLVGKTAGRCRILKFGVGGSYAAPSSTGVPSAGISWSPSEAVGTGLIWYGLRQWQQSFQDMLAEGVGWGTIKVACLLGLNDATDVACASSGAAYQGYLQAILDKMEEQFAGASVDFMLFRAHDNDPISNATALANVRSGSGLFDSANANATSQDTDAVALEADNVHYSAAGSKAIGIVRHG